MSLRPKEPTGGQTKSSPFEPSTHQEIPSRTEGRGEENPWRVYERAKRRIRREATSSEDYERRLEELLDELGL